MDQVNFDYVGQDGSTIYSNCFQRYLYSRHLLKRPEADWSLLVSKTELVFDYLVQEGNRVGFDVDSVLEIPSSLGETCFAAAVGTNKKISNYMIERGIKLNSISTDMTVPEFKYPDLAIKMMAKGINPHVISISGFSGIDLNPSSFESEEAKKLLAQFPRSVHFSIDDINCPKSCSADCSSSFKKFYFKNGELVKMTHANRIGQGGFGSVFIGKFRSH